MVGRIARNKWTTVFRKSLRLESLERREVFASDLLFTAQDVAPPAVAEISLASETEHPSLAERYLHGRLAQLPTPSDSLARFETASELDVKLRERVGQYWDGLFGKTLGEAELQVAPLGLFQQPVVLERDIFWVTPDIEQPSKTRARLVNLPQDYPMPYIAQSSIDESAATETTDDGYLYVLIGKEVHAVDLRDASHVVTRRALELETQNAQLFVSGDELIVVQHWLGLDPTSSQPFQDVHSSITVYDISDRMAPARQSVSHVEGSNLAARFSQGVLTLVQDNRVKLPEPALIIDAYGIQRFESLDSYLAAHRHDILSALMPNVGPEDSPVDVGGWQDLSIANNLLTRSTSIVQFKAVDGAMSVVASETVVGSTTDLVYYGLEDIYLVSLATPDGDDLRTFITRIAATPDGELEVVGVAGIKGQVRSPTWLNEHDGILQVASVGQSTVVYEQPWQPAPDPSAPVQFVRHTILGGANITTIGPTESGWKVLGTLENIANSQGLVAANFFGNYAVLTIGATEISAPVDTSQAIDLSNPAHPEELSQLAIPGFTGYLLPIDNRHWLGFSYEVNFDSPWKTNLQIGLYDVTDLAKIKTLDSWVSRDFGWLGQFDPRWVGYDPTTGLVTMNSNVRDESGQNLSVGVLKVDLSADDKLTWLGNPMLSEPLLRGMTIDNLYVTITDHMVNVFDISQLATPLGAAYLQNDRGLIDAQVSFPTGTSTNWRIKDTWKGEPYTIVDVKTEGEVTIKLNDDQSLAVTVPESVPSSEGKMTLTVQFASGRTKSFETKLYVYYVEPRYVQGNAAVAATFTNDAGEVLTDLKAGDEVWVTVSALDLRDVPGGVYAAYFDVSFDSENVTVIGPPEHLGMYTNGKKAVVSDTGIKSLGGFGGSLPAGVTEVDIARFKIRVNDDSPVMMTFSPSREIGLEFLVHGSSKPIDPASIPDFVLTTNASVMRRLDSAVDRQDINNDGVITALDVLQIINYINARHAAENGGLTNDPPPMNLDITNDGVISALDVLQIVNTINARHDTPSGEGSKLASTAANQAAPLDFEELRRRKP